MSESRIERMREIVRNTPEDSRARYFLAHELVKAGEWSEAAEQYDAYLRATPGDEGTGFKNYGLCLERLGRSGEAREAYRRGIQSAISHGHEALAAEIRSLLEETED